MKVRLTVVMCLVMVALTLLGGMQLTASQTLLPAAPTEITLNEMHNGGQIDLANNAMVVLRLESNPSTGYAWQVQDVDGRFLRQVGSSEFESQANMPGAPATQVLRFVGTGRGLSNLTLAYRRPWQTSVAAAKTFAVQVRTKGAFKGVYTPAPASIQDVLPAQTESSPQSLPSAFNWCDQGACTPIKDQGQCGSCWAFGTVAPLESNIKILDNVTKDLAEQYLVSCNTDNWGCNGGWWAHDYHEWKIPPGEPAAGAVYEADFPYVASDEPCDSPYTHHEKIYSWVYVDGQQYTIPSVADLKQAIYDYGPVSVAVCVNTDFQLYDGDVFSGPGCTSSNHAVALVGWDDSQGTNGIWYLRNSWDTDWGEAGYMRIEYGVSIVGYNATYVVYTGTDKTVFVQDIAMTGLRKGQNRYADATITIYDTLGNPVRGATVYGDWSGDYNGSDNDMTDSEGQVTFTSGRIRKANASFTFTVTDVTGFIYDPEQNNETSDTIVVP